MFYVDTEILQKSVIICGEKKQKISSLSMDARTIKIFTRIFIEHNNWISFLKKKILIPLSKKFRVSSFLFPLLHKSSTRYSSRFLGEESISAQRRPAPLNEPEITIKSHRISEISRDLQTNGSRAVKRANFLESRTVSGLRSETLENIVMSILPVCCFALPGFI